jgi:hypothetical protein
MMLFRLIFCALFFVFQLGAALGTCVDSIRVVVRPVQCFGLRNGVIKVDTVYGGEKPFYYSLDGQSFSTRPVFESLWSGDYTVYVRDASGCILPTEVFVPEPEVLKVTLMASDESVEAGIPIQLKAVVSPENTDIRSISWRPPYLFGSQASLEQEVRLSDTTTIAIEITNHDRCIARDQVTIQIEKTNVYMPNVISTNSSTEAYFTVFAGEGVAKVLSLQIYSRNGSLVFERENFAPNDPLKGWNGRWRGKVVQSGVYPYLAVLEYLDGRKKSFQGSITVLN